MFADTLVSFDATDVIVALMAAASAIIVAVIGAGLFTKKNVRRGVEAAVTGVSDAELTELQGIRSEMAMIRTSLITSNNLAAQQWQTMDRRVSLLEQRMEGLEQTGTSAA